MGVWRTQVTTFAEIIGDVAYHALPHARTARRDTHAPPSMARSRATTSLLDGRSAGSCAQHISMTVR